MNRLKRYRTTLITVLRIIFPYFKNNELNKYKR